MEKIPTEANDVRRCKKIVRAPESIAATTDVATPLSTIVSSMFAGMCGCQLGQPSGENA
jgi:hypothetical protein